jgi:Fur family transcriptional regulator, iron response regulator
MRVFEQVVQRPARVDDEDPRHADLARRGCPVSAVRAKLRASGLRPTRQRILLGWMLFANGDRHVTAESLYDEAHKAKVGLSLATVYNTLRQFTEAGLLRQVLTSAGKAYFDTNTTDHHHFLIQGEEVMMDVPGDQSVVSSLPEPPPGFAYDGVEVVVRLRRVSTS